MERMNKHNFKATLSKLHPELDFSISVYVKASENITFICKTHGNVTRSPNNLKFSKGGCPKCGNHKSGNPRRYDTGEFVSRSKAIHSDKYDYSKVIYVNARTPVTILCPTHGEFKQTPYRHTSGRGCPFCGKNIPGRASIKKAAKNFVDRCKAIHGEKYDYTLCVYKGANNKIILKCNTHKVKFTQTAASHLSGNRCPLCGAEKSSAHKIKTTEYFIKKAQAIHGNTYDYSKSVYSGIGKNITIICPTHGEFKQTPGNHTNMGKDQGCPKCSSTFSKPEQELREFIISLGLTTEKKRIPLNGGHREIDIFLKEKNIGIEFNGTYYHSEKFRPRQYHIHKTKLAESKGISLIHVWENDWKNKKEIIKSRLSAILGKSTKIFARKTKLKELTWKETSEFLDSHHLKGPGQTSKIRYGLVYDTKLVAVMTAGKARFKNEGLEIYRYASCGQVIGGMSKLLKHIERELRPTLIISFADRCWGPGNVYGKIGFDKVSESAPSYVWVKSGMVETRFAMQKHKLKSILKTFDPNMSEADNCHANGWHRAYDCGTVKWEKKL